MSVSKEEEARVVVGARVRVQAFWSKISGGVVQEVAHTGFRVCGLWFGWHELISVEGEGENGRK